LACLVAGVTRFTTALFVTRETDTGGEGEGAVLSQTPSPLSLPSTVATGTVIGTGGEGGDGVGVGGESGDDGYGGDGYGGGGYGGECCDDRGSGAAEGQGDGRAATERGRKTGNGFEIKAIGSLGAW
jgi:hypothetical protein